MGIRMQRRKPRHLILSFLYRLSKLPFISENKKFKLFLDLTWIFERLAHSSSMRYYKNFLHPTRVEALNFLSMFLSEDYLVLDIGCSTGELTYMISQKVKKITGIDHDILSIEQAKRNYNGTNISFIHGDAQQYLLNIPLKYDIIILSHIIEHIDHPEIFLEMLIPNTSYFYIEVPDFERTFHNIYRKDIGSKLIHSDNDHVAEFDRNELEEIFNNINLTIVCNEFKFGVLRYMLKVNK